MNKRIQQLAIEAGFYANPDVEKFEKFAQLIVEECAGIVDNYGRWIMYDKLAIKVKKHFGVE